VDMVENRFVGMKSRGVYETPGGAILHFAHRQMESLTMDREVMHQRDALIPKYAELVYNGFWYAPERLALQAYVTESQKNVTGTVRVKLYKGNIMVSGRKSGGEPLQPAHRHDGSRPDQSLQPGRRHRLHPAQRAAIESRVEGAWEKEIAPADRCDIFQNMNAVEKIKAAAAGLDPDEQFELFRWWTESDAFRQRQLAALKRDIAIGIEQLDSGRYQTYSEANVMQLAEDVGKAGRNRLKKSGT
jgi:hypothetical protein